MTEPQPPALNARSEDSVIATPPVEAAVDGASLSTMSDLEQGLPVASDAAAAAPAPAEAVTPPETESKKLVVDGFREVFTFEGLWDDRKKEQFTSALQGMTWDELDDRIRNSKVCRLINPALLTNLKTKYERPYDIQATMIPELLVGCSRATTQNIVFQQRAGTGKTVAFVVNVLSRVDKDRDGVQAIILSPTALLCQQTAEVINTTLATGTGIKAVAAINDRTLRLTAPIKEQILCATPKTALNWVTQSGRREKFIPDPTQIKVLVLDEADDLFLEHMEPTLALGRAICKLRDFPRQAQFVVLSATFSPEMRDCAMLFVKLSQNPFLLLYRPNEAAIGKNVTEYVLKCPTAEDRIKALGYCLVKAPFTVDMAVIFCATRKEVKRITAELTKEGVSDIEQCHSDMSQAERIEVVRNCRAGKTKFLVCTDVVAKGIDIEKCNVVINYDLPIHYDQRLKGADSKPDFEKHLHRVGRAGRAENKGIAIHLVGRDQPWLLGHLEATKKYWQKEMENHEFDGDLATFADNVEAEQEEENPNRVASK